MDDTATDAGSRTDALTVAERRLQKAQLAGDVDVLDELLHDELVFVGAGGAKLTKAEDLATHRDTSRPLVLDELDESDLTVQLWGDTGITRATLDVAGRAEGAPFRAQVVYTRTWIHRDGRWTVVAAHASVVA